MRAAAGGSGDAMAHIGHLYMNGWGVPRDPSAAVHWFERGVEKKSASAYVGLGYALLEGQGKARDVGHAGRLFTKAAEAGHPEAHYALGVLRLNGWMDGGGQEPER